MDTPEESPNAKRSSGKLKVPDALTVACPTCGAAEGKACKGLPEARSHSARFTEASRKALGK